MVSRKLLRLLVWVGTLLTILSLLGCSRNIDELVRSLKDTDGHVSGQASAALVKIGATAVESLIGALEDKNPRVRKQAAVALGRIKDKRAVKPLIVALKDKNPDVSAAAAEALGHIKDKRAEEALNVFNENSRRQAAVGMAEVRGKAAASLLIKAGDTAMDPGSASNDPRDAAPIVRELIQKARVELAHARESINTLPDSPGREDYLAALQKMTDGTKDIEDLAAYLDNQGGITAKAIQAGSLDIRLEQIRVRLVSELPKSDGIRFRAIRELGDELGADW